MEKLIRVNLADEEIGSATKEELHQHAWLHRAFSVFLVHENKMLIQQRAKHKYHCGGLWTNACCSHPRLHEATLDAAHRRLKEELNMDCEIEELFSFTYFARFSENVAEYEYDHVFVGHYEGKIELNPEEVDDSCWIDLDDLLKDMESHPDKYTPWFMIACPRVIQYLKEH